MYGKLFVSMYDGSLREDWIVMIVFQQMIILCDPDGVVDLTPEALSARTNIPLEHIAHAMRQLEKPDPKSRSQEKEGRRIIRLSENRDWGWEIVNHLYYRDLVDAEDKRKKARERKQRSRENQKQQDSKKETSQIVTPSHTESRKSRHTDAHTHENEDARRAAPPLNGGGAGASINEAQQLTEYEINQQRAIFLKVGGKSKTKILERFKEDRPETTKEEVEDWLHDSDLLSGAKNCRKSEL